PVLNQWDLYNEIKNLPNVIMDDAYRGKDLSIKDAQVLEKYEKIQNAVAFLHLGTTMGLEACFTGKPSFIVDFESKNKKVLSLYSFTHQTQNEKYLINASEKNTFKSIDDFRLFLQSTNDSSYLELKQKVKDEFPVISFQEFSKALVAE